MDNCFISACVSSGVKNQAKKVAFLTYCGCV